MKIKREINSLFSIDNKVYDNKHCFLCGTHLGHNKTGEHVIPGWIQRRFRLSRQRMILLNGRSITYNKLKVSCCSKCNNIFLSQLENNKIKKAFELGFKAFSTVAREDVYHWLGKIYWGLLYRELSLLMDISNPESGGITSPDLLKQFQAHLLFMQGIRGKHKFIGHHPASIFIFETQVPYDIEKQWYYVDDFQTMFLAIRMADIGIVAVLQDGGANEELKPMLEDFIKIPLHPIQFLEVAAMIAYKTSLFNRVPKYVSIESGRGVETIQMPIQGFSDKPVFDNWNMQNYAKYLAKFTNCPLELLNPEPGKVRTWIKNDDGSPNFMDIIKYPY